MLSAEPMELREAPRRAALATTCIPPLLPRAAGGLSGRPTCRIYPVGRLWFLQVERGSGWLQGVLEPAPRLTFPTLAAAVSFAELHGYDYRIITPGQVVSIAERTGYVPARRDIPATAEATGQNKTEN